MFAMFQSLVWDMYTPWDLLVKDVPEGHKHDLDYIVDMIDWDLNQDPDFYKNRFLQPKPVKPLEEMHAQGYEEYLTVAMREELNEFLEKSQIAVLKRKRALETFRAVNDLIKRDQLIEAKTYLEKIKDNEFLTKEELKQIKELINKLDGDK